MNMFLEGLILFPFLPILVPFMLILFIVQMIIGVG